MSREIRRVPANWQHPTYKNPFLGEVLKPLLDYDFKADMEAWKKSKVEWDRGKRPEGFDADKYGALTFEEWHGEQPDADYYVAYDVNADLPWWQMYETVSEGTPVTPAFATAEELIEHLVSQGEDYGDGTGSGPWKRDRAEAFVRHEKWFPTFIIANGVTYDAKAGEPK